MFLGVPTEPIDRVLSRDLMSKCLNIPFERQNRATAGRVKTIMTARLGWEYKSALRIDGERSSGYIRPEPEHPISDEF